MERGRALSNQKDVFRINTVPCKPSNSCWGTSQTPIVCTPHFARQKQEMETFAGRTRLDKRPRFTKHNTG